MAFCQSEQASASLDDWFAAFEFGHLEQCFEWDGVLKLFDFLEFDAVPVAGAVNRFRNFANGDDLLLWRRHVADDQIASFDFVEPLVNPSLVAGLIVCAVRLGVANRLGLEFPNAWVRVQPPV